MRRALTSLLALVSAPVVASEAPLGAWVAGATQLELTEENGRPVGRLTGSGACPLPPGTEVLRGAVQREKDPDLASLRQKGLLRELLQRMGGR